MDVEVLEKEYSVRDLRFEEQYLQQKQIECDERYATCQKIVWDQNSEMYDIKLEQEQIALDLERVRSLISIVIA